MRTHTAQRHARATNYLGVGSRSEIRETDRYSRHLNLLNAETMAEKSITARTCAQCRVSFPRPLVLCTRFEAARFCGGDCQDAAWWVGFAVYVIVPVPVPEQYNGRL